MRTEGILLYKSLLDKKLLFLDSAGASEPQQCYKQYQNLLREHDRELKQLR